MTEFSDAKYMSARDKGILLKQWKRFLRTSFDRDAFTSRIYKHLTLHCSFIAHYDRAGFYSVYFDDMKAMTRRFIRQFTSGVSAEYGGTWWLDGDMSDINRAMIEEMKLNADRLIRESRNDPFEDVPAEIGREAIG